MFNQAVCVCVGGHICTIRVTTHDTHVVLRTIRTSQLEYTHSAVFSAVVNTQTGPTLRKRALTHVTLRITW